jgi:hypothetical protein
MAVSGRSGFTGYACNFMVATWRQVSVNSKGGVEPLEDRMERRTFLLALFGGLAAAAIAPGLAEAAQPTPSPVPTPADLPEAVEVAVDDKAALDAADKEFSQYYYYRRRPVRRPVRRRVVYYRRPVRRVVYRRPVRRVYYRPAYYRRPVRVLRFF